MPGKKVERFNDLKFVNYELNPEERADCKLWATEGQDLDLYTKASCEEGYRFSIKWDDRSKAFACFMSAYGDAGKYNGGLMNTGRGSTPLKALRQVLYKHLVVFDKEWGGYAEATDWSAIDD